MSQFRLLRTVFPTALLTAAALLTVGAAGAQHATAKSKSSAHKKHSSGSLSQRLKRDSAEGVHIPAGTVIDIGGDGTVQTQRAGIVLSGPGRKRWVSRSETLNGEKVFVFLPK